MSTAFSAEIERATREILASDDKVEELWGLAQTHLRVFTMEKYASFDIPDWVRRVSEHPAHHVLTVQKLITAMYVTADDLGLDQGKRYVAAAVCACASEAANRNMDQDGDGEDTKNMALATALQGLASTWAAYLLWPFHATRDIPIEPKRTYVFANTRNDEEGKLIEADDNRRSDVRESVLERDGVKCVLTGHFDSSMYSGWLRRADPAMAHARFGDLLACHIFKHLYSASRGKGKGKKSDSVSATFNILRHYCQIPDKYLSNPELLDTPRNLIPLIFHFHEGFDAFNWCLKPTAIPNRYVVKNYVPMLTHMDLFKIPEGLAITFKDHSTTSDEVPSVTLNASGKRPHDAVGVDLPDPDLVRLHAALADVLHMSGARHVFDLISVRCGPCSPPVPSADGDSFMKGIVDPVAHELWESVATIVLGR